MGLFYLIIITALIVTGVIYWRWQEKIKTEVAEGSALDWAHFQRNEPEFLNGVGEEQFRELYARVHTPRFPGYALATIATFFVSLPVTFVALSALLIALHSFGAIPEPIDVVQQLSLEGEEIKILGKTIDEKSRYEMALYYVGDIAGFYYFFGVLVVWLLIVALYMRRYHARRPGYLRDEIIRSRETSKESV